MKIKTSLSYIMEFHNTCTVYVTFCGNVIFEILFLYKKWCSNFTVVELISCLLTS